MNGTLFGNRVFADVINRVGPASIRTGVLIRGEYNVKRETHRGTIVQRQRQRLKLCPYEQRHAWGHQELKEARGDPSLEASDGVQPRQPLNFGLQASRSVRQYTSVVLSHLVCGTLLQALQETNRSSLGTVPMIGMRADNSGSGGEKTRSFLQELFLLYFLEKSYFLFD